MMELMPLTTSGVGVVCAMNPKLINPTMMTPLRINNPSFNGSVGRDMVKAWMFLPVFHSPYTTVSANNAVLMDPAIQQSIVPMQKMTVKVQVFASIRVVKRKAKAPRIRDIQ